MRLQPSQFFVVHHAPLVLGYAGVGAGEIQSDVDRIKRAAPDPVVLEHPSWWVGAPDAMERAAARQRWLADQGVEHHLIVSSEEEDERRRALGVRGAFCSKNLYCDEHVFVPWAPQAADDERSAGESPFAALGIDGKFDALYIAALRPYKRLSLARDVRRLLVISYGGDLHAFCPELSHALFNYRWMPRWAVAACIRQSHCGLILSAVEGQNNATVEYQLCGVPVVSTPSRGGRDLFLDEAGSLIVEPRPEAVAEAVASFRDAAPDSDGIRQRVLARIWEHRRAFCEYVAGILAERGVDESADTLLDTLFACADRNRARFVQRRVFASGGDDHRDSDEAPSSTIVN